MYLKFVRHNQLGGNVNRGSLYTVHFEPNEKGGYNEHPSLISDAYEIASGADYPPALIYQAEVRRVNGHMRLSFGRGDRRSLLHLIDRDARERFFAELREALAQGEEVRIEIAETKSTLMFNYFFPLSGLRGALPSGRKPNVVFADRRARAWRKIH